VGGEKVKARPRWYEPTDAELTTYGQAVSDIAEAMREGSVGFLFGAGLSNEEPSGLPLGDELARQLLRRACKGPEAIADPDPKIDVLAEKMPFEAIMRFALERLPDEIALLSFLKERLAYDSPIINNGHRALLRMHSTGLSVFPRCLFTTNFDLLLEKAFGGTTGEQVGAIPVVETGFRERMKEAERKRAIAVIHLHGTLADRTVEARDIWQPEAATASGDSALMHEFHTELDKRLFVFVGCSLSDIDLRRTYFHVVRYLQQKGEKKLTYIVDPVKSDLELKAAVDIWRCRDATLLPVTAGRFLNDLADAFCNPNAAFLKQAVLDVMRDQAPKVEKGVNSLCEAFPDISAEQFYEYLYFRTKRKQD